MNDPLLQLSSSLESCCFYCPVLYSRARRLQQQLLYRVLGSSHGTFCINSFSSLIHSTSPSIVLCMLCQLYHKDKFKNRAASLHHGTAVLLFPLNFGCENFSFYRDFKGIFSMTQKEIVCSDVSGMQHPLVPWCRCHGPNTNLLARHLVHFWYSTAASDSASSASASFL